VFVIGCVLSIRKTLSIKFLRQNANFNNTFIFPNEDNIEGVSLENIVHNFKKSINHGKTKRQMAYYKFDFQFDFLNIR